jgi:hypothetical protein
MPSVELSHRVEKVVAYRPLREMSDEQRRPPPGAGRSAASLRLPDGRKARVPSDSVLAPGRYDRVEGRVELLGGDAERELCPWLGVERLDPAELARSKLGASSG